MDGKVLFSALWYSGEEASPGKHLEPLWSDLECIRKSLCTVSPTEYVWVSAPSEEAHMVLRKGCHKNKDINWILKKIEGDIRRRHLNVIFFK